VQFRLLYRGSLRAHRTGGSAGSLNRERHNIRRQLHPQLKELWEQRWHLKRQLRYKRGKFSPEDGDWTIHPAGSDADAQKTANKYKEGAFRFLPIVTGENGLACKLDILFMRRDSPGKSHRERRGPGQPN
jgi:hypothetical protein